MMKTLVAKIEIYHTDNAKRKVYFPDKPTRPPSTIAPEPPPSEFAGITKEQFNDLAEAWMMGLGG